MLRRIVAAALPVAAVAMVSTFFPSRRAEAYPASCDTTFWACMYSATSVDGLGQCWVAFEKCSGNAPAPPPPQAVKEN